MGYYEALILAIIEGITEYLPVSSTAHLVLASQYLGLKESMFLYTFNIVIQLAPILSVMIIFRKRLTASLEIWKKLIAAFIPVGIIGFLFADHIDALFSVDLIPLWMFITGLLFIIIERYHKEDRCDLYEIEHASYRQAVIVGLFQAVSLVPGISRSGSTILGAMLVGFTRETAMAFSFLLAIPTMGAASGYTLLKEYHKLDFSQIELLAFGFVISFIVGWIAVKALLGIIARYSFVPFGVYLMLSAVLFYLI